MGIFDKLFGGKEPAQPGAGTQGAVPVGAPRRISYDPQLVGSLTQDHEHLVALYRRIGVLLEESRLDELRNELVNFKTRFEAHVLTENVRFYVYLEQHLTDGHDAEVILDFRREMNGIARAVVAFVKRYQSVEFDAATVARLREDYASILAALSQRLEREEGALYPLYRDL